MSDDLLDLDLGLRELSELLVADATLETTMQRIATLASRCLRGGAGATIVLTRGSHPYTAFATDDRVRQIDERQFELREGPAVEACKTGEHRLADLFDASAELHAAAIAAGVRSVLSVPLIVRREVVGALDVYAATPAAFEGDAIDATTMLAAQAAVTLANVLAHEDCVSRIEQLQEALDSRVVIEQAKGIVMARERCSPDAAFDRLRVQSQHQNRKVREIATELIERVVDG